MVVCPLVFLEVLRHLSSVLLPSTVEEMYHPRRAEAPVEIVVVLEQLFQAPSEKLVLVLIVEARAPFRVV